MIVNCCAILPWLVYSWYMSTIRRAFLSGEVSERRNDVCYCLKSNTAFSVEYIKDLYKTSFNLSLYKSISVEMNLSCYHLCCGRGHYTTPQSLENDTSSTFF